MERQLTTNKPQSFLNTENSQPSASIAYSIFLKLLYSQLKRPAHSYRLPAINNR